VLTQTLNELGFDEGFTAVPNSLIEALKKGELSGREIQILFVVLHRTVGFRRKTVRLKLKDIAAETGMRVDVACKTVKRLVKKGFLFKRKLANRLHLGLRRSFLEKDQSEDGEPARVVRLARKRGEKTPEKEPEKARKVATKAERVRKTERKDSASEEQIGKESPQAPQPKNGSTKIATERTLGEKRPLRSGEPRKNTLVRYGNITYPRDAVAKVISEWQRIFGKKEDNWSEEEIIAADYMLQMLDAGRLENIKNPAAYLTTVANALVRKGGLSEEFEPYPEREKKRIEAERAYRERLKREAEKRLALFKAEEEATREVDRIYAALDFHVKEILIQLERSKYPTLKRELLEFRIKKALIKRKLEGTLEEFLEGLRAKLPDLRSQLFPPAAPSETECRSS